MSEHIGDFIKSEMNRRGWGGLQELQRKANLNGGHAVGLIRDGLISEEISVKIDKALGMPRGFIWEVALIYLDLELHRASMSAPNYEKI